MTKRTLDLDAAAQTLGVSKEALRKRIKRGSVEATKESGRWKVFLPDSDQDKQDKKQDSVQDNQDNPLIEHLRGEIDYLRQENYRKDSIIIELTKRVPLIEGHRERKVPWYRKLFIFNRGGDNDQE